MKTARRSQYADFIAKGIQYAIKESRLEWPASTILVTTPFSEMAEIDEIMGMRIFVTGIPTSFDFFPAFPAEYTEKYKLFKYFMEYMELYAIEEEEEDPLK